MGAADSRVTDPTPPFRHPSPRRGKATTDMHRREKFLNSCFVRSALAALCLQSKNYDRETMLQTYYIENSYSKKDKRTRLFC